MFYLLWRRGLLPTLISCCLLAMPSQAQPSSVDLCQAGAFMNWFTDRGAQQLISIMAATLDNAGKIDLAGAQTHVRDPSKTLTAVLERQEAATRRVAQELANWASPPKGELQLEVVLRLIVAEHVLGRTISPRELELLWQAHRLEGLKAKREILQKAGFRAAEMNALLRTGVAGYEYVRKFRISDPPDVAQAIINDMTIADAMPMGAPPGVQVSRVKPGVFQATTPIIEFRSKIELGHDGYVREYNRIKVKNATKITGFMMGGPLGSIAASKMAERFTEVVHNTFTSPERAYEQARARYYQRR